MSSPLQLLLTLASLLLVSPVVASGTAVLLQYDDRPMCTGSFFELFNFNYDCGAECALGREVNLTGKIYFDADIATAANITVIVCPTSYDWSCYTASQTEDVDMCDKLTGLYSGQTCPSTGTYLYDFSLLLPGSLTRSMFWGSYAFEVRAIFVSTAGESTECSIALQTVQSKYQMTLALTGFATLIAGAATLALKRRRRLMNTSTTSTGSSFENEGVEFQMMRDSEIREAGAALP